MNDERREKAIAKAEFMWLMNDNDIRVWTEVVSDVDQLLTKFDTADKIAEQTRKLERVAGMLATALEAAQSHLEYCGYGDSWENEGAYTIQDGETMNLPDRIDAALTEYRKLEGKPPQPDNPALPVDERLREIDERLKKATEGKSADWWAFARQARDDTRYLRKKLDEANTKIDNLEWQLSKAANGGNHEH